MRAAVLRGHTITVQTLPDPTPAPGKLLIRPLFAGICGSDLSTRKQMTELEQSLPADQQDQLPSIVPGHEFCGEIVDIPTGTETKLKIGDLITANPFTHDHNGPQTIGLSPDHSGGLATLSCVDETRTYRVPEGIAPDLAALTEPLAVGYHAMGLASRNPGPNIVIGCGPVGLAVILALKLAGRGPVIAADYSAERAAIAEQLGADRIINPAETSPYDSWQDTDFAPLPMSPLLEREFKGHPPGLNIFECTGADGVLSQVVNAAPPHTHIVVVGVCPHEQKITPLQAIIRELTLEFSFAYRPEEFAAALATISKHPELAAKLITSRRPLRETEAAFDALARHPSEIKILITPQA